MQGDQNSFRRRYRGKDACGRPITKTGPTVAPDPSKVLGFIAHLHTGTPTPANVAAGTAHYPYPGPGDGITPVLRRIPNYVISEIGASVVRPGIAPGTVIINQLTPNAYGSFLFDDSLLNTTAQNVYNQRNNKPEEQPDCTK